MRRIILIALAVLIVGTGIWLFLCNGLARLQTMKIAKENSRRISELRVGMSKKDVLNIMGKPYKTEVYSVNKWVIEFMFYRTHEIGVWFSDSKDNFFPVAIDTLHEKVLGLGKGFYNKIAEAAPYNK